MLGWKVGEIEVGTYVMALLVHLVANCILGCLRTGTEGGIRVFGDVLVGLGRSVGGGALDRLRNVANGVSGRLSATSMMSESTVS